MAAAKVQPQVARPHLPALCSRAQAKMGGGGRGAPHTLPPGGPEGFFSNSPGLWDWSLWSWDPPALFVPPVAGHRGPCLPHVEGWGGTSRPVPPSLSSPPPPGTLRCHPAHATSPSPRPCTDRLQEPPPRHTSSGSEMAQMPQGPAPPLHAEVLPRRLGPRHCLPHAARSLVTAGCSRPAGV